MTQQQLDLIRRAIALTIERSSRTFRRLNGLALLGLGAAFVGSAVGSEIWPQFPRWVVLILAVALVVHALLHTTITRGFEEGERRAWCKFLAFLMGGDSTGPRQSGRASDMAPGSGKPALRLFKPKEE